MTKEKAIETWIDGFNFIPTSVIEKLYNIEDYPSEFEVLASPSMECCYCGIRKDCPKSESDVDDIECEYCEHSEWNLRPFGEYAYPVAWGTLFNPRDHTDEEFFRKNAYDVAVEADLYVFDSDDFGILLGVDGAGYNFMTHWVRLYNLRGLQWHSKSLIKEVSFPKGTNRINLTLDNDSMLFVHLHPFPILSDASKEELNDFEIIKNGSGIKWNHLNKVISVERFIDTKLRFGG